MPKTEHGERSGSGGLVGRGMLWARAWGPAFAWMLVLFLLSAWPGQDVGIGPIAEWIARKCAHFAAYGVLAGLLYRALARSGWSSAMAAALAAVILAGIFGLSDETHQMYVPARVGTWTDVGFDTLGALTGAAVALGHRRRKLRWRES
jgi:VanZ family protein